jgi:hypothetical protein
VPLRRIGSHIERLPVRAKSALGVDPELPGRAARRCETVPATEYRRSPITVRDHGRIPSWMSSELHMVLPVGMLREQGAAAAC